MSSTDMEFFIVFQKKPSIEYNVRNLRTAEKVKEKKMWRIERLTAIETSRWSES